MRVIKLFCLEDHPDDEALIRDILKEVNLHTYVDFARRKSDADIMVRTMPYDAVFADICLTDSISGSSFLEGLAATEYKVPLVALTNLDRTYLEPGLLDLIDGRRVRYVNKRNLCPELLEQTLVELLSRSIRVLYLEPDAETAQRTRQMLEQAQPLRLEVTHVPSVESALQSLEQDSWDVMLVDWTPGMEAAQKAPEVFGAMLQQGAVQRSIVMMVNDGRSARLPPPLQACVQRRSIGVCDKNRLSTASLTNAIMAQRNNRRFPNFDS